MFKTITIRQKLIIGYSIIAILCGIGMFFSYYQMTTISKPLEFDIPRTVEQINVSSELDTLAQYVRYYDEVLTQSARNYAFTEDVQWKNRYNAIAPGLNTIIKELTARGTESDKQFFESVNEANLILVELETQAITAVDQGNSEQAIALLESSHYWDQKAVYKQALDSYVKHRELQQRTNLVASIQTLADTTNTTARGVYSTRILLGTMAIAIIATTIMLGFLLSRSVIKPISMLAMTAREIAKGDLSKQTTVYSKDEIGELAQTFNEMTAQLKRSYEGIELKNQELQERMKQVEKLNNVMVGREVKMVELKDELNKLKGVTDTPTAT